MRFALDHCKRVVMLGPEPKYPVPGSCTLVNRPPSLPETFASASLLVGTHPFLCGGFPRPIPLLSLQEIVELVECKISLLLDSGLQEDQKCTWNTTEEYLLRDRCKVL